MGGPGEGRTPYLYIANVAFNQLNFGPANSNFSSLKVPSTLLALFQYLQCTYSTPEIPDPPIRRSNPHATSLLPGLFWPGLTFSEPIHALSKAPDSASPDPLLLKVKPIRNLPFGFTPFGLDLFVHGSRSVCWRVIILFLNFKVV